MEATWGPASDGDTQEIPVRPQRREVYGRVYELILRGQPADEHSYVGKTTTTIHRRIHGTRGHMSPESVAKDPWKARILPGRAGYRQLEVVYRTGEGEAADRAALARAESFWIDRLRTVHNDVRPVRPATAERPARRPAQARPPVRRRRRTSHAKTWALLLLIAGCTALVAFLLAAGHAPAVATWVASPAVGSLAGWRMFSAAHRKARKIGRMLR